MTSAPSAPHPRDGRVGSSQTGLSLEQVGPDVVELLLPADPAYLGVVRTACAGLGARLDLTLDEIEDLRIAVDEACTLVLPPARGTSDATGRLRATFSVTSDTLSVRVQGPNPALPSETSYAWAVLEALAGDVSSGVETGGSWISLSHARARAS